LTLREVLEAALAAEASGEAVALVTVVASEGSTPQKAGARMLVHADGRCVGTIGGGALEAEMCRRAREVIATRCPCLVCHDLTPDQAEGDALVCGGRMQVFIDPIEATPVLCLFGAGHVARPLARMAKACGFRVEVADDRAEFANAERFPDADRMLVDDLVTAAGALTLGPNSYAIVATRGHKGDAEALEAVVARRLRFVGLLGSRQKVVHIFAALVEKGVRREDLARVHAPLGLGIGARSPEEIAVSILAEMIAVRRGIDPAAVGSMKMEVPGLLAADESGKTSLR
jgi:xanthine dehydrogenase accessory factor